MRGKCTRTLDAWQYLNTKTRHTCTPVLSSTDWELDLERCISCILFPASRFTQQRCRFHPNSKTTSLKVKDHAAARAPPGSPRPGGNQTNGTQHALVMQSKGVFTPQGLAVTAISFVSLFINSGLVGWHRRPTILRFV